MERWGRENQKERKRRDITYEKGKDENVDKEKDREKEERDIESESGKAEYEFASKLLSPFCDLITDG